MGEPFAKMWPVKTISMDLTEDCSLRCKYCFVGDKTKRTMTWDVARATIDWFVSRETSGNERDLQIDLWGGEPTMRWGFAREVIIYGNKAAQRAGKRIRWNMTTNGMHMTEKVCRDAALANVSFMLSFDGVKEVQDANRPTPIGTSSYDIIVQHLPHMKAVHGTLRVRMTVAEDTVHRLLENVRHIREDLDIPQIAFSLAHETAWGGESIAEFERQMRALADWYIERKRAGDAALWVKAIDDAIGRMLYPQPLNYYCGAGRGYLSVSVDGVVYPCHRFHPFADQRPWQEQPMAIGTVWDGLVKVDVRRMFIDARDPRYCHRCPLRRAGTCPGSCYAVNYIKSGGDILIPAYSSCMESRVQQAVAEHVYNSLVGVPAFQQTLRRIARERRAPMARPDAACLEPGRESLYVPGIDYIAKGLKAEMDVLEKALSAIRESVQAIEQVLNHRMQENAFRLQMLAEMEDVRPDASQD